MQKRFLPALFTAVISLIVIVAGCTKMDTTTLGSDLVTVDNVNTFADTLQVNVTQGFFTNDSTILKKTDNYIIGNLTTDPLFGKTNAAIYVQFKPTYYPFGFGTIGAKDTIHSTNPVIADVDSAFVCFSYRGTWGDTIAATTLPQTFEVRKIVDADFRDKTDTLRKLSYQPNVDGTLLGSATITPQIVQQEFYLGKGINLDSVTSQIRIKLNTPAGIALMRDIYNQDSTAASAVHNFYSDSLFAKYLNGFAVTVNGPGNTLYYVNLGEARSRLEFHYHKKKVGSAAVGTPGAIDTVVQSFQMFPVAINTDMASSSANYVKRDYTGAQILSPLPNSVYIQASPGTYASLKIPGLTGYTNRIVHRAYLIVEQTPDVQATDNIYTTPPYLYLDLKDTSTAVPQRYKPIYFDLNPSFIYNPDATDLTQFYHPYPATNVDLTSFGARALERYGAGGIPFTRYELNMSRYVQHIVTNGYHNYDLRLYAPYSYYYPQYPGTQYIIPYYVPLADGRLRAGTGAKTDPKAIKLVIVYSKIP